MAIICAGISIRYWRATAKFYLLVGLRARVDTSLLDGIVKKHMLHYVTWTQGPETHRIVCMPIPPTEQVAHDRSTNHHSFLTSLHTSTGLCSPEPSATKNQVLWVDSDLTLGQKFNVRPCTFSRQNKSTLFTTGRLLHHTSTICQADWPLYATLQL